MSEQCSRAYAEFVRRITPWPVEPPLQVWLCPMSISYPTGSDDRAVERLYNVRIQRRPISNIAKVESFHAAGLSSSIRIYDLALEGNQFVAQRIEWLVQDRSDIDISGPDFDFIRSIRIFDVQYASQTESRYDGDCNRNSTVVLGVYGAQGEFSWQEASIWDLPDAHVGLEEWGLNCPEIDHRSVFVDWQDYSGRYGFEQVSY